MLHTSLEELMVTGTVFTNALPFVKMQGIGNDFVVLDLIQNPLAPDFDFTNAAIQLCDRHFGIGADGLLTLEAPTNEFSPVCTTRMRMWNPDGTEDMCGNGLRCVAALAAGREYAQSPHFWMQTLAGKRQIEVLKPDMIRVSMGKPDFSPHYVPIDATTPLIEGTISFENRLFEHATSVSTGSTHTVLFSEREIDEDQFQYWSPRLEIAPMFPARTSLMWAYPKDENHFKIRIWERGVGETLACGTGACAVAVAAIQTGRAKNQVIVESRGGILNIEWDGRNGEIWKTGLATVVFKGIFAP